MNFYQLLESKEVKAVLLCHLKTRFNGPLYFYKQRFPDRSQLAVNLRQENTECTWTEPTGQSELYHVLNMNGQRALALYVIVRTSFSSDNIPLLVARLEEVLGAKPILVVKPVDQGKLSLEGVTSKNEVKGSFEAMTKMCEEYKKGGPPLQAPNLQLFPPASTIFGPASASDENRYVLKPFHYEAYRVDEEMHFDLYVRLVNRSDSIMLGKDGGGCSKKVAIKLSDLDYSLPAQFSECLLKPGKEAVGAIVPGFIPNVVANSRVKASKNYFPFIAHVGIRIPPSH